MFNEGNVSLRVFAPEELYEGLERLKDKLNFSLSDCGVSVEAVKGGENRVCFKNNRAKITYTKKNLFFRLLGVLLENLSKKVELDIVQDSFFQGVSAMIDTSRCGVPTVESICEMIDYLALMGYDMAMLYTEDTVKLESREYFGYMRGRYLPSQFKAIDDYAYTYGIEIIPCIECYGHMEKYLFWSEARDIKDTNGVLLAREEKTFEFVEELIKTVSGCLRSKRIHIGMDEAWDMGRGRFLDKHGYVPPFEIFTEYMDGLMEIIRRLGLKPMMWSDMYFRMGNPAHRYYEEDTVIPPEVAERIPEDMELVFWHYGEKSQCDDYMLKKHCELGRRTIYAGGLWSWIGHFPEHNYTIQTVRFSLDACRNNGVREAMATIWTNDNAECDLFCNLFGLSYFAELCFDKNASEDKLRSRFEACTGGSYDGFWAMSLYHNDFDVNNDYPNYSKRFLGKHLFWQDIMEGLFDTHLYEKPMSSHYAASAVKMREFKNDRWDELYRLAEKTFDYLAVKTLIAERLVPAYKDGNRDILTEIAEVLLPLLKERTVSLHEAHRELWFKHNNVIGWANLDIRYAGVAARCDTAILLLKRYLDGKDDIIASLEEPRLHRSLSGFVHYSAISSPNLKI